MKSTGKLDPVEMPSLQLRWAAALCGGCIKANCAPFLTSLIAVSELCRTSGWSGTGTVPVRKGGPSHHSEEVARNPAPRPREGTSAGFNSPGTQAHR